MATLLKICQEYNLEIMLNLTSCQSENADAGCREIAEYLAVETQLPINFVDDIDWQQRRERVDSGKMAAAWMCGLWYVKRRDDMGQALEPLVAPIMAGERYENRPIYYSNLVVHAESSFSSLQDLQQTRFAINEPDSHSGCVVMGYELAQAGLSWQHFASVEASGGHLASIDMLLNHAIDAAAIDSTVLETELRTDPSLATKLRTIAVLQASPIPPWTVHEALNENDKAAIAQAFLTMHQSTRGAAILRKHGYRRFTGVNNSTYDDIRSMRRAAASLPIV